MEILNTGKRRVNSLAYPLFSFTYYTLMANLVSSMPTATASLPSQINLKWIPANIYLETNIFEYLNVLGYSY